MAQNWLAAIAIFVLAQGSAFGQADLEYRGQGLSPWCLIFSEEQLLKDRACGFSSACDYNSAELRFSIFDLAKIHSEHMSKLLPTKDRTTIRDLFTGYGDDLPYEELGIKSVRNSKCTLEKAIFYINRSKVLNPKQKSLYEQIADMNRSLRNLPTWQQWYSVLEKNLDATLAILAEPTFQIPSMTAAQKALGTQYLIKSREELVAERRAIEGDAVLSQTFDILTQLAHSTNDTDEFVGKVLNYSTCSEQIDLPLSQPHRHLVWEPSRVELMLKQNLANRHVLSVGVCSEVLEKEVYGDPKTCGNHAIVVKRKRGNSYLVVDSSFFSHRPRNTDGSMWIPKNVLVMAIAKLGTKLRPWAAQMRQGQLVSTAQINAIADDFIRQLKAAVDKSPDAIQALLSDPQFSTVEWPEVKAALAALKIRKSSDLDQIRPLLIKSLTKISASASAQQQPRLQPANLIWME